MREKEKEKNAVVEKKEEGGTLATSKDFTLVDLWKVAHNVAQSDLFPSYKGPIEKRRANLFSLFMLAQARQIHPMEAMLRFHVIEGQPTMKAESMLAEFLKAGGKVRWLERTNDKVAAEFWAPNDPEAPPLRVEWTMKMAKDQGIALSKFGGLKENWKRFPRQMLTARVISEAVRLLAPDVIGGFYSKEELEEVLRDVPVEVVETKQYKAAEAPDVPNGPPTVKEVPHPYPKDQAEEAGAFEENEIVPTQEAPQPAPVQPKKRGPQRADASIHAKVAEALKAAGFQEFEFPEIIRQLLGFQRKRKLSFLTHKQCVVLLAKLKEAQKEEEALGGDRSVSEASEEEPALDHEGAANVAPAAQEAVLDGSEEEDQVAPAKNFNNDVKEPLEDPDQGTGKASKATLDAMRAQLEGEDEDPRKMRPILAAYLKERFGNDTETMRRWVSTVLEKEVASAKDLTLQEVYMLFGRALDQEGIF